MKKRWIAGLITLGLMAGTACAAPAPQTEEICGYPTADALAAQTGAVTRGTFLEALAQASGEDLSQYADLRLEEFFTDGENAPDGVKWAFAKWVLNGSGTEGERGRLDLSDPLTREQAAALLGRYLDYRYTELPAGCGTGMPDLAPVAAWAQEGVTNCWMYDVIETNDQPDFRPKDTVSGADAAEWIKNANNVTASAYYAPDEAQNFADVLTRALDAAGNWSVSPYSVRMCLAMLANGAEGATRDELLAALHIDDLAAYNESVKQQLATYDGYARIMSLETANSLWLNQSRFGGKGAFLPNFTKTMQDSFRAAAEQVTDADSVERVNAWVDDKTHGKIPSILTEDNREFATALVNAVYFKAAWENEFLASLTDKADFTNADGTTSAVDMMHQTDYFDYYATPGIEAIKLDYRDYAVDNEDGEGWERFDDADFSMYLIKGGADIDVQDFLDQAEFTGGEVRVSVPKFKVEYGEALDKALQALGVKAAYDPEQADLSAMVDPATLPGGQHYLDTVLHRTYLAVDEKGTEAAAVTAAMDNAGAAMPTRPALVREFTADEPFTFVIRDNAAGEILFVGRYENAK